MQLPQPAPDALVSFSDFLLERFGLVASMQVAVVASIAFHAFLIVGLGFRIAGMQRWDEPHNVMDVVLVNAKSAAKPRKADALAQANLDGGGNTDRKLRASSPLPALDPREPSRELHAAEGRVKQLEAEAKELMTRVKSDVTVARIDPQPSAKPDTKADAQARDLIEKSLEIERLEAQIRREHQAYQERPKRTFVGARAAEYRFAQYVDNWRQKIERIGNLNYPAEAKANRIYGSLQLTVAIKADGEVESVEINKSSGHKVLDQAAVRIVRLAAPFERFPQNIRADTDILHITRTWTFTRGDQVVSE
ncbi:MAG TPA: energy transducer TonB [Usitatibacter sp.]|jgi:protein TonB|nr:energy transducer TonB [Usitatibacter sp.]